MEEIFLVIRIRILFLRMVRTRFSTIRLAYNRRGRAREDVLYWQPLRDYAGSIAHTVGLSIFESGCPLPSEHGAPGGSAPDLFAGIYVRDLRTI